MTYEVENIMELLVEERLDDYIASAGICSCEHCRADAKAIALNKLPTRYVSRRKGNMIARLEESRRQNSTDVVTAIVAAIEIVGANPRHEEDQ